MRRVEQVAEQVAARWRARVAARLTALAGVTAERAGGGVRLRGRRLRARWLTDARLRWLRDWL